jgi:hypothetical protein
VNVPTVTPEVAANFRGKWLYKGQIAVAIDNVSVAFATDFANYILQAVFSQYTAEQEAAKKKLVIADK